jgi:N-methylhydantoinase A/oxoprolinase/acetone carboxylase beta subunit
MVADLLNGTNDGKVMIFVPTVKIGREAQRLLDICQDALAAGIAEAHPGNRDIYGAEWKRLASTPIYDGYRLQPGNQLPGPCVIETTTTSIVVHPGQTVAMDALRNFVIDTGLAA